jgi:hypothetical protein
MFSPVEKYLLTNAGLVVAAEVVLVVEDVELRAVCPEDVVVVGDPPQPIATSARPSATNRESRSLLISM